MMTLKEQIDDLEQQLRVANEKEKPALLFALAERYAYVDFDLVGNYLEQFFASSDKPNSRLYVAAELLSVIHQKITGQHADTISGFERVRTKANQLGFTSIAADAAIQLLHLKIIKKHVSGMEEDIATHVETLRAEEAHYTLARSFVFVLYDFYKSNNLPKAGEILAEAVALSKQVKHKTLEAAALIRLANWCNISKQLDVAHTYFHEAVEIARAEGARMFHFIACNSYCDFLMQREDYANAIDGLNELLELSKQFPDAQYTVQALNQLGLALSNLGRLDEAQEVVSRSISICEEANDHAMLIRAYISLAELQEKKQQVPEAVAVLEKAMALQTPLNREDIREEIQTKLHVLYFQQGEFEKAYITLCERFKTRDLRLNEQSLKQAKELEAKFATQKKEAELRELKIKQQQTELARSESELKAIKAQMNPHFIFNALNSIQEMFFIGDKRLANEHLGQFSQLTRQILKASGKQYITLSEEVEMLDKYLQLEGLRFEKDFSFSISVNDESVSDDVLLPPMLIQPYVENSIRHGLLHQTGDKEISVQFHFDEAKSLLTCRVEDNGIGREAAAKINAHRSKLHESFSISANAKRLELLNQNREERIGVLYEDLQQGTRVTIQIPVNYD